jgi:uncharacterized protein YfaQ (DUF2300 family)
MQAMAEATAMPRSSMPYAPALLSTRPHLRQTVIQRLSHRTTQQTGLGDLRILMLRPHLQRNRQRNQPKSKGKRATLNAGADKACARETGGIARCSNVARIQR